MTETLQKSENVAKNVANKNSQDLTEQWKKGELLEDFYYVRCAWSDEVEIRYVHNGVDDWKEVVAEVPDYVEWRNMVNCSCEEHEANKRLIEENAQLKELLKQSRIYVKIETEDYDDRTVSKADKEKAKELLTKIDEAL